MEPERGQGVISAVAVPTVDVRVVLFTVSGGRLRVALRREQHLGLEMVVLPRGTPRAEESLDAAATRVLAEQIGVAEQYQEQLYSLSQQSEQWTVSVTYLALALDEDRGRPLISGTWFDVGELPAMDPVDRRIVDYALLRLRAKLGYTTIAFHLLPLAFSLSELQHVYEAVLDRQLDKRNFRRRIHAEGFLEATGASRRDGSHRPARLYRFRAAHDAETYLTPPWATNAKRETSDR
jgi:8-oxo-dGTP diphosphatase